MQQKLQKILIVDSSTLIALERGELIRLLEKLSHKIIIPRAVAKEVGDIIKGFENVQIEELKGKTLKLSRGLESIKIGKGESQCVALAKKYKTNFVVCDDRRLMRQIAFSEKKSLREIKLLGFSFFLDKFYKKGLINDVWDYFNKIIERCQWKRSEVQIANYTFLKERGYVNYSDE